MRIISGGQTGADRAALEWAKSAGLETGGWMPADFRAEEGDHPEFEALYGIRCAASRDYPESTERNLIDADATFIFGDISSPGCRLAKRLCEKHGKRWLNIYFPLQPHDKAQFMYMLSLSSAVGPNAVYNWLATGRATTPASAYSQNHVSRHGIGRSSQHTRADAKTLRMLDA